MKMKSKANIFKKGIGEWISSYLIVLIIPIVICACFYLYSFFSTWRESHATHSSSLKVAAKQIDDIFERAISLEYSIMNNESLQNVAKLKSVTTVFDREKLVIALRSCELFTSMYADISNYAIFFPNISAIISPGRYTFINGASNLEKEYEWMRGSELYEKHDREFFVTASGDTLCYITSLPLHREKINMNLVFEIDSLRIKNILSYLDIIGSGGFLILDKEEQIIFSYNLDGLDIEEKLNIEKKSEYNVQKINGKKMLVSCLESEVVDIKYVSIIPFNIFWASALENLIIFLIALLLCILIGFCMAWFMAALKYKTYIPILRLLNKKQEEPIDLMVERKKKIAEAINNIVTEYENMQGLLQDAEGIKREFLLASVMEGKIRAENAEQVLRENGFKGCLGHYVLVMFRHKQFEYVYGTQTENYISTDTKILKQILLIFVKELEKRGYTYETINIGEKIFYLIKLENQINEIISVLQNIQEIEKSSFTISVSDVHENVGSLSSAYAETVRVMEYQLAEDTPIVMSYVDMISDSSAGYLFSAEKEVELTNLLKCGDTQAATNLVKDICSRCIAELNIDDGLKQCLFWDLAACIVRFEKTLGLEEKWIEGFEKKLMHEKIRSMEKRIELICKTVMMLQENKEDTLINNVKKYVLENYRNPNLSNTVIADQFNLNASYLSTYFKDKTGVTLLNYVRNIRFEKAKELIKNTKYSLEEVSRMVGYANSKNLISLFKKYEGVTPTNYRKNIVDLNEEAKK